MSATTFENQQELGSFLTWKWAVGILISILLVLGGFLANDIMTSVKTIESEHIIAKSRLDKLEVRNEDIISRLQRIEQKLDNINVYEGKN